MMTVGPVLVTAEAPRTPKLVAWPSGGAVTASAELVCANKRIAANPTLISDNFILLFILFSPYFTFPVLSENYRQKKISQHPGLFFNSGV
jgi:hypothetical protein